MLERWMESRTSPFEQLRIDTEAYSRAVKITEEIEMKIEEADAISSKRARTLFEAFGIQWDCRQPKGRRKRRRFFGGGNKNTGNSL